MRVVSRRKIKEVLNHGWQGQIVVWVLNYGWCQVGFDFESIQNTSENCCEARTKTKVTLKASLRAGMNG